MGTPPSVCTSCAHCGLDAAHLLGHAAPVFQGNTRTFFFVFVSSSIFYSPQSDGEADLLWKSKSVSSAAPPTLAICFSYPTPISWVPYGLAESWHGAQRSAVLLGVMSDRPTLVCPALPSVAVWRHTVFWAWCVPPAVAISCLSLILTGSL